MNGTSSMLDSSGTHVASNPDAVDERPVRDTREPRPQTPSARTTAAVRLIADAVLVGVVGAVISAVVIRWDPRLWRVYFTYEGDTFFNAMNGALANPLGVTDVSTRAGWPYGLHMVDFPAGEPLFTWLQWVGNRFTTDQFTVLAALWFLGFVLVGATTHLVLRGLDLARWPAVIAALVYDFVPFHLWRATGHTNLALYMAVPLAGMVLLWLLAGRLDRPPRSAPGWRAIWRTPDWWAVSASVVVIALSARYYTVFFLLLLVPLSLARALIKGRVRLLWAPVVIAAATLFVALLTGLPQILQTLSIGGNAEVANRPRTDSDLYALRLTDLLAPIAGHRFGPLAHLSAEFRNSITRGEDGNSLGFFLLAGLTFLGLIALARRTPWRGQGGDAVVTMALSSVAIAGLAFLIGTVGGLGGVIASLGYTQIRSWNRISIFISFFGAVGVALGLTWLWRLRRSPVTWRRVAPLVILPLVLALAVLDQTNSLKPTQAAVADQHASDQQFFGAMADELGTGSSVFQMPYVAFPESGGLALDYVGFRGFLNDGGRLNWSYGGMRGRESDWQRTWITLDLQTQVVGLAAAGFDAVMVDRVGYTPQDSVESGLQSLLGAAQATSPDGRFVLFDLRSVHDRLLASKGADWVKDVGARVTRPIGIQIRSATYRSNGSDVQSWGSLGASDTIQLRRYDDNTDPVDVSFDVKLPSGNTVTASSGRWQQSGTSASEPVSFAHRMDLQSVSTAITIATPAPNTAGISDPRPDVRAELFNLHVLDATLAEQIARGDLKIPPR